LIKGEHERINPQCHIHEEKSDNNLDIISRELTSGTSSFMDIGNKLCVRM
ncbi:45623_t:CDS:1, partial [Gigaspora margarita]